MLSYLILCSSRGAPALCTYQYSIEQLLKFGVAQEIISQTTHPVQSFTASHLFGYLISTVLLSEKSQSFLFQGERGCELCLLPGYHLAGCFQQALPWARWRKITGSEDDLGDTE